MDEFKSDLRSVLTAEQDGIPIQHLDKQFHDLCGQHIEFDTTQYPNLEAFLLSIPDICRVIKYDLFSLNLLSIFLFLNLVIFSSFSSS